MSEPAPITWTNITVRLGDLKPWADNPRQSTKKQAEKLLQSWRKFGQVETVAIEPDFGVLNGHQRLSALLTVYGKDYVIEARQASRHLTEAEKRELTITLHAGAVGQWDWDLLSSWEAAELQEWGFDESLLTNWRLDVASLGNFLESEEAGEGGDAEPQIDRAGELQKEWGTAVGQLWTIGEHRLICGDCTDQTVVDRLMGGERVDVTATDIPYEVTPKEWDVLPELDLFFELIDSISSPDSTFFTTSTNPLTARLISMMPDRYRHSWVWNKKLAGNFLTAESQPMAIHEDVTVFASGKMHYKPMMIKGVKRMKGGRGISRLWEMELTSDVNDEYYPKSIIEIPNTDRSSITHPTEKPVALYEYLLAMYSKNTYVVYDPFGGSGTTMVACHNLGRKCFMIELDPGYTAVILRRMADAFPGITAELIGTI